MQAWRRDAPHHNAGEKRCRLKRRRRRPAEARRIERQGHSQDRSQSRARSHAPSSALGSQRTLRWRESDFEPSVPHKKQPFLAAPVRSRNSPSATKIGSFVPGTDGSNPISLQAASLRTIGTAVRGYRVLAEIAACRFVHPQSFCGAEGAGRDDRFRPRHHQSAGGRVPDQDARTAGGVQKRRRQNWRRRQQPQSGARWKSKPPDDNNQHNRNRSHGTVIDSPDPIPTKSASATDAPFGSHEAL